MVASPYYNLTICITKKEFKVIYKCMKTLVSALNKKIQVDLRKSIWSKRCDRPDIQIDISSFKQGWKTAKIGKCPIYTTIYIKAKKNSDTYLALENYIAKTLIDFCNNNYYRRIITPIFNSDRCIGRRKDRFKATLSPKYPWFDIAIRGSTNPNNNNFRIIIKSEYIFRGVNTILCTAL